MDLGASYWHSCMGSNPNDRRNRRPPQRSISGLAKIYNPRVAIVAGGLKWEDPVHSLWYHNGQIDVGTILKTNLFLGRVYDRASHILRNVKRVKKDLLIVAQRLPSETPLVPSNNIPALDSGSFIEGPYYFNDDEDRRKCLEAPSKRRCRESSWNLSDTLSFSEKTACAVEDPFLYQTSLTSLDQIFASAENDVRSCYVAYTVEVVGRSVFKSSLHCNSLKC